MDAAPPKDEIEEEEPSLTLGDLQNLLLVVNVACKRGAVQPAEMKKVGEVYDRLDTYIKYALEQSKKMTSEKQ